MAHGFFVVSASVAIARPSSFATYTRADRIWNRTPLTVVRLDQCPLPYWMVSVSAASESSAATDAASRLVACVRRTSVAGIEVHAMSKRLARDQAAIVVDEERSDVDGKTQRRGV